MNGSRCGLGDENIITEASVGCGQAPKCILDTYYEHGICQKYAENQESRRWPIARNCIFPAAYATETAQN
jgi:hypothetical protein